MNFQLFVFVFYIQILFGNKYVEKYSVYSVRHDTCERCSYGPIAFAGLERRERCTYTCRIIISLEFYCRTSSVFRKTTRPSRTDSKCREFCPWRTHVCTIAQLLSLPITEIIVVIHSSPKIYLVFSRFLPRHGKRRMHRVTATSPAVVEILRQKIKKKKKRFSSITITS